MSLRYGFKTEAHEIVRDVRRELGLKPIGPLDAWQLAVVVKIPLVPLSNFKGTAPLAYAVFHERHSSALSGVTVFVSATRRIIIYNDAHSRTRQANDIAHELAHGLLQHHPGPALDEQGCRYWDPVMEEEATWLGGALLVSEEAALAIARSGVSTEEGAHAYGVSPKLMLMRLNVTGARVRARRVLVR